MSRALSGSGLRTLVTPACVSLERGMVMHHGMARAAGLSWDAESLSTDDGRGGCSLAVVSVPAGLSTPAHRVAGRPQFVRMWLVNMPRHGRDGREAVGCHDV